MRMRVVKRLCDRGALRRFRSWQCIAQHEFPLKVVVCAGADGPDCNRARPRIVPSFIDQAEVATAAHSNVWSAAARCLGPHPGRSRSL